MVAAARVPEQRWKDAELFQPSYNATPGAWVPVLVKEGDGVALQSMRWGLVPSYTGKEAKLDFWRMFNARRRGAPPRRARVRAVALCTEPQTVDPTPSRRSETVDEKPVFSRLLPSRRCVVLLTGFYEWREASAARCCRHRTRAHSQRALLPLVTSPRPLAAPCRRVSAGQR